MPDCDLLVVERHTLWPYERQLDGFVRVLSRCRQRGVPVVYELDDNLLDLHRDEPWETYPGDSLRGVVAFLARQADGMIVSTPALAERVAHLRSEVLVVPNALDERLFGSAPEPLASRSSAVTIGYMGTLTHEADLRMVLAPLRALLAAPRRKGAAGARGRSRGAEDRRRFSRACRSGGGIRDARTRIRGSSRGCGSIFAGTSRSRRSRTTRSRACKSDLKYLDYAALGIPGVFSDVRPYRDTVRHRETGLLAANEPEAWAEALEEIVSDGALRARLAEAAKTEVHGNRMLRTNATRWSDAIETIVPGFFG